MTQKADDETTKKPSAKTLLLIAMRLEETNLERLVKEAKGPPARAEAVRLLNKVRNTHPPFIREDQPPEDVIRIYRQRAGWLGIPYDKQKPKEK